MSHLISSVTHRELGSTLSSFLSVTPSNHSSTVLLLLLPVLPSAHFSLAPSTHQHPRMLSQPLQPPTPCVCSQPLYPTSRLQAESVFWPVIVPLDFSVAPTAFQVKVRLNKRPSRSCSFKFPPALAHLCCRLPFHCSTVNTWALPVQDVGPAFPPA